MIFFEVTFNKRFYFHNHRHRYISNCCCPKSHLLVSQVSHRCPKSHHLSDFFQSLISTACVKIQKFYLRFSIFKTIPF